MLRGRNCDQIGTDFVPFSPDINRLRLKEEWGCRGAWA